MSRLMRSISAEWRKTRSTKLWWILMLVIAAYSAMMAATFAFMFSSMGDAMRAASGEAASAPVLPAQQIAEMVYSSVTGFAYAIPLLFGALIATGELRHRTLGLAFILEPKRGIVLLAKAIVLIVFGLGLGVAGLIGAVGAGAPILSATGGDNALGNPDTWALMFRVAVATGCWALIGFGVGVLVRNQAFAIVLVLVFTQFVEPVLRLGAQVWEWSAQVAKFLPGAASDSFVGASLMNNMSSLDPSAPAGGSSLGMLAGLAVLLAYAVVSMLAGWAMRWRGDID